ncbi:hypothetical protein PIB30_084901 [Stylosanthes scabra]|uniref:Uncharacterized protein n=1 Tax=Stylosanthes scabra TaxID=79078 RepID=A0ABU6ZRH2_9FABA|nr:hypothetical protein [Stylosanthes scabra]
MNQNLVPIPPARIPRMIKENFQASRPFVHGMLRTRRSEGSSSGLDQQTPPAANTPREPKTMKKQISEDDLKKEEELENQHNLKEGYRYPKHSSSKYDAAWSP